MLIAQNNEGGFDGKIRFHQDNDVICEGKLENPVKVRDASPLILAIHSKNSSIVSTLLKNDKYVNLRESLKGPSSQYLKKGERFWQYKFTFAHENNLQYAVRFESLGLALLCDCEQNDNKIN